MIGVLYVVLTALLMIGEVLGQEGPAAVLVLVLIAALTLWAVRSKGRG